MIFNVSKVKTVKLYCGNYKIALSSLTCTEKLCFLFISISLSCDNICTILSLALFLFTRGYKGTTEGYKIKLFWTQKRKK